MHKLELLSPAGDREALTAAVQNGADAVYLGSGSFHARRNAGSFDGENLAEAIAYCHARNVKVYVTVNTIVREDELSALEATVQSISDSGADAVIVQDFGAMRAVRAIAPQLPIHASTQMAVHNRQGVDFLVRQGVRRVVLAREMTYEDMRACANRGAELEAFVHGALCVACSGQCLMSSLVGGRSGNRGLCAQPCRLNYSMDGAEGALLSTRDLCSIQSVYALSEAGIGSLKIEGRLKRPEYVAVVTAAYRGAIDGIPQPLEPLQQIFNRGGFTRGYAPGVEDSELMFADRPNHLGVQVGKCTSSGQLMLSHDVSMSDALVLRADHADDRPVKLGGQRGEAVTAPAARKGDQLIRLVSDALMRDARESYAHERRATPIQATLKLRVGEPAALSVTDGNHTARIEGETVQAATSRATDAARIEQQIRKTGGTPYCMDTFQLDTDGAGFIPVSELNALRRDALDMLSRLRAVKPAPTHPLPAPKPWAQAPREIPEIYVQSDSPDVLRRALEHGTDGVCFAPMDVRAQALSGFIHALPQYFSLYLPPVLPEHALDALNTWANRNADRIVKTHLTNIGQFALRWPGDHIADYMLHPANSFALEAFQSWGCDGYTPSAELNCAQINRLSGPRELIVHGRMTLMYLRHCPYRAAHKEKGKHLNCQRCDHCAADQHINARALSDRKNAVFPLRRLATDEGCIVYLNNSVPLMLLKKIQLLPRADAWRLLLDESDSVERMLRLYRQAARGEDFRADAEWPIIENTSTTTGHYFRGVD